MAAEPQRSRTLRQELRSQTSDLHSEVETVSDLPASVATIHDYGVLLSAFYQAHRQLEGLLESPRWSASWAELGVDIAGHGQLQLLERDLHALGLDVPARTAGHLEVATPEQALGCLYVLEGSSLGRRTLCPLLHDTLGPIPSAFFGGAQAQVHRWQAVIEALGLVGEDRTRRYDVVVGARLAFSVFLVHLTRRAQLAIAGRR